LAHTVVIVDDNAAMRRALCRLFKTAGEFRICGQASNGREAIDLARRLNPDLIVLDLCMPDMNGLEIARELKSLNSSASIILYSMNSAEIAAPEARVAGVAALVSKAEGIETLITKARVALNQPTA